MHATASAQYADAGTGSLRGMIWWFNWADMNLNTTDSKTITLPDGLEVTYSYTNTSAVIPEARVMNTWMGAVLHVLYNFTDPTIKPAIYQYTTVIGKCSFTINVSAKRNNVPVPFTLVAADAEASSPDEYTNLITSGDPWQTIDFFRNSQQTSNPLQGCNTTDVWIHETHGNAAVYGQNPILASTASTGAISVNTLFDHRVPGGIAVALGILAPIDRGDLPASYGTVQHGLFYNAVNSCNFNPPLPATAPSQQLKLGAVPGDADAVESLNDNATGIDEDGVNAFTAYANNGTYSLAIDLSNTTGNDAWLTGWFDYNRNDRFDNGESATVVVPNNATTATVTWTGLPTWLQGAANKDYAFRFRLSSSQSATQQPTGYAPDGEVEDYWIPATTLCFPVTVQTINDTAVCANQPVLLSTASNHATDYSWDNSAFLSGTTILSPTAIVGSTTRYIIIASNPQGCAATDTVLITLKPPAPVAISNDTTICRGTAAQLWANTQGATIYTWSPQISLDNSAVATPLASPASATTYEVAVAGPHICPAKAYVTVKLHPRRSFLVNPVKAVLCEKDSVLLTAMGGDDYTWLAPDGSVVGKTAALFVHADSSQTYDVLIKENTCNTSDTRSIPITVNELPLPLLTKSNDVDCTTGMATLHVRGGSRYVWDSLPGIVSYNTANPVVTPPQTTTYGVTVFHSNGCSIKDSITVQADFTKAVSTYAMPNAFTPNGDGHNDCFGLKNWGQVTALQFQVFNRWGEKVFSTNDPSQCWNGRYKGTLQSPGGFTYIIKAVTRCGSVNRSGMVLLLK